MRFFEDTLLSTKNFGYYCVMGPASLTSKNRDSSTWLLQSTGQTANLKHAKTGTDLLDRDGNVPKNHKVAPMEAGC